MKVELKNKQGLKLIPDTTTEEISHNGELLSEVIDGKPSLNKETGKLDLSVIPESTVRTTKVLDSNNKTQEDINSDLNKSIVDHVQNNLVHLSSEDRQKITKALLDILDLYQKISLLKSDISNTYQEKGDYITEVKSINGIPVFGKGDIKIPVIKPAETSLNAFSDGDRIRIIEEALNDKVNIVELNQIKDILDTVVTENDIQNLYDILNTKVDIDSFNLLPKEFKTINGESVVGKGDIVIVGGEGGKGDVQSVSVNNGEPVRPDSKGNVNITVEEGGLTPDQKNTLNEIPDIKSKVNQIEQESQSFVKNNQIANSTTLGLVKVFGTYGIAHSAGMLYILTASGADIQAKTNVYKPITPSNLDVAVKEGLCNNAIILTPQERASIQSWLGGEPISEDEYNELTDKTGLYFVVPKDIE